MKQKRNFGLSFDLLSVKENEVQKGEVFDWVGIRLFADLTEGWSWRDYLFEQEWWILIENGDVKLFDD